MQQLHLVGFTADLEGLIFSAKKGARSGAFVVTMDEALMAALEDARKLVSAASSGDEIQRGRPKKVPALGRTGRTSSLSVREVQSRLRSGSTLAEVADAAGVDEEWVERFAAPVLAEQAAVVANTLPRVFSTSRKGPSSRPLGESVRWNLADRGILVDDGSYETLWSAFQVTPGQWAVRFTYISRGRAQVAEWELDAEGEHLTARNRLASDLAHVEAGARRKRAAEVVEVQPRRKSSVTGRKRTASKRAAPRKTGSVKKAAAKKSPAKKVAVKKTAVKAVAAKKAVPSKAAAKKTAATKTAAKKAPPAVSVAPVPAPHPPGTRGVTAAQANARPPGRAGTIGTPGRPVRSSTPYRPNVTPRPATRPAPRPASRPAPAAGAQRPAAAQAPPVTPTPRNPPQPKPQPANQPTNQPAGAVVGGVPIVPRRPSAAPSPEPADGTVRRLPSPSPAAVAQREHPRPVPTPSPGPPATAAKAGGRPPILVINAEQAGRRRSRT